MSKANQKTIVVAVNKVLSASTAALLSTYAEAREKSHTALLELANAMYCDGIRPSQFIAKKADDVVEKGFEFNPLLVGEIDAALAKAIRGDEGVKIINTPNELLKLVPAAEQKAALAFKADVTTRRREIGKALKGVYVAQEEREDAQKREAMMVSELVDQALNDLSEKVVNIAKSRRDINTADVAVALRDCRRVIKALKGIKQ
jgi:hypothetical protein